MQRVPKDRTLCWVCVLFLILIGFGTESKPLLALEKSRGDNMDLIQVARELRGVIVQVVVPLQDGKVEVGSGFWVNERGYVATCWHVVAGNPTGTMKVQSAIDPLFDLKNNNMIFANWEVFSAKIVAKDEKNDLALLKTDGNPFGPRKSSPIKIGEKTLTAHYQPAALKSELPEAGQKILLAGYPLGRPYPVVQEGIVASVAHSLPEFGPTLKFLLSTVAYPGNSGGPILDGNGKAIGVLEGGLPSRPGRDPAQAQSGIAVAIPAHFLIELLNTIHD